MSKTHKINCISQRMLALALALLLCLCLLPVPVRAAGGNVAISTADELKDFLKSCALDSYSKGLSAKLTADIDLRGDTLTPAPVFYGSFDGGGFTISGFVIKTKGSEIGLFRSLEAGSTVSDLSLSGEVAPSGSACCVGILCGKNQGTISGCSVSGSAAGANDVGGLVGVNTAEGRITACSSDAAVSGDLRVGGISGSSAGTIEASKNDGTVSCAAEPAADSAQPVEEDEQSSSESNPSASPSPESGAKKAAETSAQTSDIGGITGLNLGAVRGCANQGSVGGAAAASVGGIAGRHSGIISSCENDGEIRGATDVGGIAGRFEPHMAISLNAGTAAELQSMLSQLTATLRSLTALLASASGETLESVSAINSAVSAIDSVLQSEAAANSSAELTVDTLYGNLQIIGTAAEKISAADSDFGTAAAPELTTMTSELQTLSTALESAGASDDAASILSQLDSISAQRSSLAASLEALQTLTAGINDALKNEDSSAQERGDAVAALLNEYYASADENAVSTALQSISASTGSITAGVKAINGKLSKSSAAIIQSMQLVGASAGKLEKASASLTSGAGTQASIINANLTKIVSLIYGSSDAAVELESAFGTVYTQLCIVCAALDKVVTTADATDVDVYTKLSAATDELYAVGQSLLALADPPLYSTVDVAENIALNEDPGQISSCLNNGAVSAYENAGGIAGIIAMRAESEAEGSAQSSAWAESSALFRAIVMTSSNTAPISAVTACAGGVAGRCDIGAIYSANNSAAVEVSGGSYCGGIVGLCSGSVISCDALSDLTGSDYVGGIAGLGRHLSDCRAMVRLFAGGEYTGAIAGDANGDILGNVFVEEGLQGINGISYAGAAEPMPYDEFIQLEFIDPIFTDLNASFYIDGKLVKRLPLTYGGSIKSFEIPSIPPHEDGYGSWEAFDGSRTLRSMTINAEFSPWITTLYSAGEPAPLYADGQFSDQGAVEFEDTTPKLSLREASRLLSSCTYSVSDPGAPASEQYFLHLRCEQRGDISVTLVTDSGRKKLSAKREGDYLSFEAPASGTLEVRLSQTRKILLAVFIILVILILLCFYIYMQKHFPGEDKPDTKPKAPKSRKKARKPLKLKEKGEESGRMVKALFSSGAEKVRKAAQTQSARKKAASADSAVKSLSDSPVSTVTPVKERSKSSAPAKKTALKPSEPPAPDASATSSSPSSGSRLNITIGEDGIDRKV